jgi:Alternative complex III, ActD subunit
MNGSFKIGIFVDEEKFVSAIRLLLEQKFVIYEVFTPYPVHEVFHLMKRKSRLPTAAYFFGLAGIISTLAFLYYTSVISWPLVYGGKPFNSFPSFIVVTLVLTILTATILSLGLFSARSKLYPGRDNTVFDYRATDNMFVIVLENGLMNESASTIATATMSEEGAVQVIDKDFQSVNK